MLTTRRTLGMAALALLLCGPLPPSVARGKDSKPKKVIGGQVVKKGELLIVRGLRAGEPQLTDEQGKRFLLTGKWRKELLRLGGHKVQVWGQLGKKELMQPTVDVERYEIFDSGAGRKPEVGVLLRVREALQLRQEEKTIQVSARPALRKLLLRRVGCKVWIVGELSSGTLKASKFGWLSCNTNTAIKPKKETPR